MTRKLTRLNNWMGVILGVASCLLGTASAEGSVQVSLGSTDAAQPFNQFLFDYDEVNTFVKTATKPVYVDIRTPGEVINVALCGSVDADTIRIEVYNPSGTLVATYVPANATAAGKIACNSSLNAPITNAYKYATSVSGTYQLRLYNTSTNENHFKRFDITVTPNTATAPDPRVNGGRVWAYAWAFNGNNSFGTVGATDADYFVRVPGGRSGTEYIWKLDLNRFAGQRYEIIANSIGLDTPNSGYSADSSASAKPVHPIYLSYPTQVLSPPTAAPVISNFRFEGANGRKFISPGTTLGVNDSGSFKFTTDVDGTYAITIDTNKDGIYSSGDRLLLGTASAASETSVAWDGKDVSGNVLAVGTYNAELKLRLGEYHFVAFDVETSGGGVSNGLTVYRATSQTGTVGTQVYWDDVTKLAGLGGTTNLPNGGASGTAAGAHTWGNFAAGSLGDTRYLDTYVYGLASSLILPAAITSGDAEISGKVYNDVNANGLIEVTETGIPNATLQLLNSSQTVVMTAQADSSGNYAFLGVGAGTYTVRVVSDSAVSGKAPTTPNPAQRSITVDSTAVASNNFGFISSVDLALDKSGPVAVGSGGTVSYTVRVWNNGPDPASGVAVNDTIPAGFTVTGIACLRTGSTVCGTQTFTSSSVSIVTGNLTLDTTPTNAIPDGNFLTYTITGTAAANGALSNTASLSVPSGQQDGVVSNNTSVPVVTRIVDAVNESTVNLTSGNGSTVGVLNNDTNGGAAATTANSLVTVTNNGGMSGLTVNGSGQLVVPSTAPVGTYTVTYMLCDSVAGTACDIATVQIVISAPTYAISGQVYEDYNYGGGLGRDYNAGQGMSLRPGVRVELYNSAGGNILAAVLTDSSGAYTFTGQPTGTYRVRVVNGFVTSSRAGGCIPSTVVTVLPASCTQLPVQTYSYNTSLVGGANPAITDPALSTTTLPTSAQSVATVTVGNTNVPSVNFGFNFSTVVNVSDAGQGSLRQFIVNANALANTGLAQNGNRGAVVTGLNEALPAARDTSIFMVPSAALQSGVAVIPVSTPVLPALTRSNISIDGTTQTINIGNGNLGTLGTGGVVGYLNTATLDTVQRPEVQIVGTSTLAIGLDVQANSAQIRGLSIYGFGNAANNDNNANIRIGNDFTTTVIEANIIGSSASTFSCGAATTVALRTSNADNIRSVGGDNGTVQNNLIGCAAGKGFGVEGSSVGWTIINNEIRGNAIGNTNLDGIALENGGSKNHIVRGNLIVENAGVGVDGYQGAGGNLIERNTIMGNGIGQGGAPGETAGVRLYSSNNTVKNNVIALNYGAGVLVTDTSTGNLISQNSIYDNGTVLAANGTAASAQIGIDLSAPGESVTTGTAPYVTRNDNGDADTGGNSLLNFPVFETAQIIGSNLQLTGYARAGSTIELFIAAADVSGFGEGKTYLLTLTEGSGQDTDTSTGTYNTSTVGTDTTNRFKFSVALPAGVGVGTRLTATATCLGTACTGTTVTANSTSEFSYNIPVTGQPPSLTLSKLGRNISTTPVGTFIGSESSIGVKPGETVEYCIVYSNTGGAATNFVLKDYVPVGMVIVPNAYSASKGVRYASGATLVVGASAAPAGLDLTNANDTDEGILDGTPVTNPSDPAGSPQRPGLMTLTLPTVNANSTGTVCFQAKVP